MQEILTSMPAAIVEKSIGTGGKIGFYRLGPGKILFVLLVFAADDDDLGTMSIEEEFDYDDYARAINELEGVGECVLQGVSARIEISLDGTPGVRELMSIQVRIGEETTFVEIEWSPHDLLRTPAIIW